MTDTLFTVRNEHISRLGEVEAVELFREILWAEAFRIRLPSSLINISLRTKVPDGGLDASARNDQNINSNIFSTGLNGYQIKAGDSFRPWQKAALQKELFGKDGNIARAVDRDNLGESVRNCLDEGGMYILVCSGHDLVDSEKRQAETFLESFFSKCGYITPRLEVWGIGQLVGFLKLFPSLALRVNGNNDQARLQTFSSWANEDEMRHSFVYTEEHPAYIKNIRDGLETERHIRIVGSPGMGKTRLALEALNLPELRSLVIYFQDPELFIDDLMYILLKNEVNFNAIIVVDECDPSNRSLIWGKLKHSSATIKLITIYSDYDDSPDIPVLEVPQMDDKYISEILHQEYKVPEDHADRWAKECGGYPRVAHMVGINLRDNTEDLLVPPSTNLIWQRFIAGSNPPNSPEVQQREIILQYLSLFKRFGYESQVQDEARAVARLIERENPSITWGQFALIIEQLRRRKILQGRTTLQISPKLLHIKLWRDWWEMRSTFLSLDDIFQAIETQTILLDWFFEMFEYAAGSQAARKTVQELLSSDGPFHQNQRLLQTERGARFFRYLGAVEPAHALRCLQRTVGTWTIEDLLNFTEGRRQVIWTLEKIAVWRDLFPDAARLLLALAEAENETWSNNASGVFPNLFSIARHPRLSSTEASPSERFPIIQGAMESESKRRRWLGLQAGESVLQPHLGGQIYTPTNLFSEEPAMWVPATYGDLYDAYRQVWNYLSGRLTTVKEDERQDIAEVLVRNARYLGVSENLVDMVVDTLELLITNGYVDSRSVLEVVLEVMRYEGDDLTEITQSRWQKLQEQLSGDDFHSRLRRYVGMNLLEDHIDDEGNRTNFLQAQITKLAEESLQETQLLLSELGWLITTEAVNGYQFGFILSQLDTNKILLSDIIAAQQQDLPNTSVYFFSGYLRAIYERESIIWEELLDSFVEDSHINRWIPELTFRAGKVSDRGATRILSLIRGGISSFEQLHMFRYGRSLEFVSEEAFLQWIEFLVEQTEILSIYVALDLYTYYYIVNNEQIILPENTTWELLTHSSLCHSMPIDKLAQSGTMQIYHWGRLAALFLARYPLRAISLAEFIIQQFGKLNTIFSVHRPRGVQSILNQTVVHAPIEIWLLIVNALSSGSEQRYYLTQWLRGYDGWNERRQEEEQGALSLFPPQVIWDWVDEDIDEHAWFLASFVPRKLFRDEDRICWAREVLVHYGHREDVRRNLQLNFSTGGWSGPDSIYYQNKIERLLEFREGENNDQVLNWIDEYIEVLEKRVEHAQIVEERED